MTKGTQLWPGDRMRAFFLAHIRRETALDAQAADKLADVFLKAVNRMLVWEMPEPVREPAAVTTKTAPSKAKGKTGDGKAGEGKVAGSKSDASKTAHRPSDGKSGTGRTVTAADGGAFDPYQFSAMVVLSKTGKDGLMKRLAEIRGVEHLKAFAEAQHLGIDRALSKPDELRKAIAAATEQRLADRRAAAS